MLKQNRPQFLYGPRRSIVKKVCRYAGGFLRIECFAVGDMTDSRKFDVVTEVVRKDSIWKIEDVKIREGKCQDR